MCSKSTHTLTIFTPSFNRANTIVRTYKSLCRQSSKDFEWLIIDDGSTDNLGELVKLWQQEAPFTIRYFYQENQGMHGAHNTAYRNIHTELNVCIDSDDYMPDNAVWLIIRKWAEVKSEEIAGIIGLDCREDGSIIGKALPKDLKTTTLTNYYANGGDGDKKLVYRTDVIKKYPEYPIFAGEKYVGLAYKYMLIDQDYKLAVLHEPLVIVEYQEDGSSNSMYRQYWNNPKGFAFYRKTEMVLSPKRLRRLISCIHYVSSSIISHNKNYIKESPKKFMTVLASPLGWLLFLYIRHKVKHSTTMKIK